MIKKVLTLDEAIPLIKEADIMLYRDSPSFIGWLIRKYGGTPYSHAAIATVDFDGIKGIEFREFIGSRKTELIEQVNAGNHIDIFRCAKSLIRPYLNPAGMNDERELVFSRRVAKTITDDAKKLIGLPYGYRDIWTIFKTFIPGYRFIINKEDIEESPVNLVCSTLPAFLFRKHFIDPVPFIADEYVQPSDLARSRLFFYMFSIAKNPM